MHYEFVTLEGDYNFLIFPLNDSNFGTGCSEKTPLSHGWRMGVVCVKQNFQYGNILEILIPVQRNKFIVYFGFMPYDIYKFLFKEPRYNLLLCFLLCQP